MSDEQLASIVMSIISKKIYLVGESEVGKNSLIHRFGERQFSNNYLFSLGMTISRKTLKLSGLKPQKQLKLPLLIWGTIANPKFKAIVPRDLRERVARQ
jgi:GTPase SAR1 family protein